jgi:hypothetical protein
MSALRKLSITAAILAASPVFGAVHLLYMVNGNPVPVAWPPSSFPIRYVEDSRVAQAFPPGVIERAVDDWTVVPGAQISFEDGGVMNGIKAGKDGQNSITFVDGLFKDQNFLAVTTNWYDSTGHMAEADVQIDPTVIPGGYNLQMLVEHEFGHVLGLDHSGVLSSIMYPFVGKGGIAALDTDDQVSIASLYPEQGKTAPGATLQGRVMADSGGVFAAQVVAMNDSGEPVATALTDQGGHFEIDGVPQGTYQIYAEPLDGPVDIQNLSGIYQTATSNSFPTEFLDGGPLRVETGRYYGNLTINVPGKAAINPKWIGAGDAAGGDIALGCMPVAVTAGRNVKIAVGGDGFVSGVTTFEVPNSNFQRVSDFTYAGNYVTATFTISPQAKPGSLNIIVKSGNDTAALTGALRVVTTTRGRVVRG